MPILQVVYLSSVIRSIVALHDLINNKLRNKEALEAKSKDRNGSPGKSDAGEGSSDGEKGEAKPNESSDTKPSGEKSPPAPKK